MGLSHSRPPPPSLLTPGLAPDKRGQSLRPRAHRINQSPQAWAFFPCLTRSFPRKAQYRLLPGFLLPPPPGGPGASSQAPGAGRAPPLGICEDKKYLFNGLGLAVPQIFYSHIFYYLGLELQSPGALLHSFPPLFLQAIGQTLPQKYLLMGLYSRTQCSCLWCFEIPKTTWVGKY